MKIIPTMHCQNCASTDIEDLETGDEGNTACCNEPVMLGGSCDEGHCTHGPIDATDDPHGSGLIRPFEHP